MNSTALGRLRHDNKLSPKASPAVRVVPPKQARITPRDREQVLAMAREYHADPQDIEFSRFVVVRLPHLTEQAVDRLMCAAFTCAATQVEVYRLGCLNLVSQATDTARRMSRGE